MKKFLSLLLITAMTAFMLIACDSSTVEVSREIMDWSYTAPYDSVETDYVYKYNLWKGEFDLVPKISTVHHDAEYQIKYRITYDDGTTSDIWETVTAAEYKEVTQ